MTCAEVREEFSALMDGELAPELRAEIEAHLAQCSECLRELDALRRIDRLYRELPPQSAPQGFEESVRRAIDGVAPVSPRLRIWPRLVPLLAAAIFLVVLGGVVLRNQMNERAFKTASIATEEKRFQEQRADNLMAAPKASTETVEQLKALGYMKEKSESAPLPAAPAAQAAPTPPAVAEPKPEPAQLRMLSKAPAPAPRSAKPALKADAVKSEILLESAEKPQQAGARDAAEAGPREDIAKGGGTGLQAGASPAALAPEAVGAPAAAAPRFQERESGKARAEQTAPIRASRDTARRYVERGDALLAQGELDRAVSNYESAVELAPQDVEALTKLGDALLRQGKKEEALGRFTEAARLEPRNTAALCGLGRAFDLLGRKEEAIQQFRKALEVDPNCAPAKQGLGEN